MTSDGSPWRPITHIEDICEAMLCALTAPKEAVAGEAFNVGADAENYRIREIAEIVARTFPGCALTDRRLAAATPAATGSPSPRSARTCPSSAPPGPPSAGRRSSRPSSSASASPREMFEADPFTRLKELKYLRGTGQLDEALYWNALEPPARARAAAREDQPTL